MISYIILPFTLIIICIHVSPTLNIKMASGSNNSTLIRQVTDSHALSTSISTLINNSGLTKAFLVETCHTLMLICAILNKGSYTNHSTLCSLYLLLQFAIVLSILILWANCCKNGFILGLLLSNLHLYM